MGPENEADVVPAAADESPTPPDDRQGLRDTYGRIATGRLAKMPVCCGSAEPADAFAATYAETDTEHVPVSARELSLACGNPAGLAMLEPGQTVLDLGSGGGLDCFLAAERVGASGFVIGIDMTPGMLDRARAAQRQRGTRNVEFRLGEVEHLPVADRTIDVVISNCVINLVADKAQVFREAYRTLKPGGQLVVSDMMIAGPLPEALRAALGSTAAQVCVEPDYLAAIEAAGFVDVEVVKRVSPQLPRHGDEIDASAPAGRGAAQAIVHIGDTGETRTVDIDPASLPGGLAAGTHAVLSQSVTVRARKPS